MVQAPIILFFLSNPWDRGLVLPHEMVTIQANSQYPHVGSNHFFPDFSCSCSSRIVLCKL